MNYPPIIPMMKKKASYIGLIKKYLSYYYKKGIIYRLFKAGEEEKRRFLKSGGNLKRDELSSFTESGDCYFPFFIKINKVSNIFALKDWFENSEYNKNEMMLPNFTYYPKKDEMSKKNKCCFNFFSKKPKKSKNEAAEEKQIKKEDEMKMKLMTSMAKKNQKNDELQEKLNRLKIKTSKDEFYNFSLNSLVIYNKFFGDTVSDCIDYLNTEDSESEYSSGTQINLSKKINPKFKKFYLEHFSLPFYPTFVRIRISLLYGSYSFLTFHSKPVLFSNELIFNDRILFDNKCLISNLPFETRIELTVEGVEQGLKKSIVLGSCQVPVYKPNGQMQSGNVEMNLWPNVKTIPRINNCFSFNLQKEKETGSVSGNFTHDAEELLPPESYPIETKDYLKDIMKKMEPDFKEIINIYNNDKKEKNLRKDIDEIIRKIMPKKETDSKGSSDVDSNKSKKTKSANDTKSDKNPKEEKEEIKPPKDGKTHSKQLSPQEIELKELTGETSETISETFLGKNSESQEKKKEKYCSISITFPKFSSPLIYSQNCTQAYRNYLEIKYRTSFVSNEDDFVEIRRIYGNSQQDIDPIVKNFNESNIMSEDPNLAEKTPFFYKQALDIHKKDNYPRNIWEYISKTLPLMVQILKKDPLEALDEKEIVAILICRDYISTIPSALELFLRAIDWLNPLQVSIAHLYIKKWAKLEVEDAISLLDARFPDTETREFAVKMLRNYPDDLISMYMLQLCQSLLYETFLLNPLSDFLIERSLSNPKLIGNSFFWNSRVSMKNPLFAERLSAYLIQILTISGQKYLNDCFNGLYLNDYLEFMTYFVKITSLKKKEKPEKCVLSCLNFFEEKLKLKNFTFPIDPTYFGVSFTKDKKFKVFGSKMLPILLFFNARENNDTKNVIFKIGDDLRQDVLTLQIFKIMDKLWLDNNLDLKLLPYKVCPTELKAGFIECLKGTELDKLQMIHGMGGALNRELIVKFLRGQNTKDTNFEEQESKFDNFIKSLAGYCVATCVIGVGDRHPGNIMIKDNGIFFHIDFGHILGNFKSKFFIKRERSPFLLTPEMANVYITENKEEYFKSSCVKAFNILRHNAQRLINMFIIMSTAGMPELCGMNDVKYMKKMLVLDKQSDEDAGNYFIGLIKKSRNDRFRLIDNMIHNLKH